ncbi:hypothetical protein [Endozoicomonas sp. 2B-B]
MTSVLSAVRAFPVSVKSVSASAVAVKPVFVGGYAWTPNFNGINSYVEIPEWKPEGAFEIEIGIKGQSVNRNTTLINDIGNSIAVYWDARDGDVSVKRLPSPSPLFLPIGEKGTIRVTGESWSNYSGFVVIGKTENNESGFFKGQISNIKLTDHSNLSNSRFYECIICSEKMPTTTLLEDKSNPSIDKWAESTVGTTFIAKDVNSWKTIHDGGTGIVALEPNSRYLWEVIIADSPDDTEFRLRLSEIVGYIKSDGPHKLFLETGDAPITQRCYIQNGGAPGAGAGAKVTSYLYKLSSTAGIMTNFGTDQPYVILEDDNV